MTKYIIIEKNLIGYVDEFGNPVTFNADYVATLPIIYDTIEPESWEDDDTLLIIFLFIIIILIKNNRNKK